jgi:hypothetical protein
MTDAELIEVAAGFRRGIVGAGKPDFMCAAVCWPLQGYLSALCGIEAEAVESDLGVCNHIWLLLPDGRALDPTGDQFNYCMIKDPLPPIYLGPPTRIHTRGLEDMRPTAPDNEGG